MTIFANDPNFSRPSFMEVNLAKLKYNFSQIKNLVGKSMIMSVVKANAYGHGLVECARCLESVGTNFFGVAFLEEGVELRKAGIKTPILVFGGIVNAQIEHFIKYDLDLSASSVSKLQAIDQVAKNLGKKARVHLKIDTGMERTGIHYYSANNLLELSLTCENCEIIGIFSHFATSESKDNTFVNIQLQRFNQVLEFYQHRNLKPPIRHIANTAACLQFAESHFDMVRPGIGLYGVYPSSEMPKPVELKQVISLKSCVVYFKVIKEGAGVSYGLSWKAPGDTRIATVPVGYGDGFFRRLSNRGHALIRGKKYQIVGSVCMDQMMVNLGPEGEAYNGDEVVLIGKQGNKAITVNEIADLAQTIPYEVLTSTNMRIPRKYIE